MEPNAPSLLTLSPHILAAQVGEGGIALQDSAPAPLARRVELMVQAASASAKIVGGDGLPHSLELRAADVRATIVVQPGMPTLIVATTVGSPVGKSLSRILRRFRATLVAAARSNPSPADPRERPVVADSELPEAS